MIEIPYHLSEHWARDPLYDVCGMKIRGHEPAA